MTTTPRFTNPYAHVKPWLVVLPYGSMTNPAIGVQTWTEGRDMLLREMNDLACDDCGRCGDVFQDAYDELKKLPPGARYINVVNGLSFALIRAA